MTKRVHKIRQEILRALADCYPGGRDLDSLLVTGRLADLSATREEVLAAARLLEAGEYVRDVRGPGRDPWWKIAQAGMMQIQKEATLDEVVWGEEAL
jgi:hypothetical protein